MKSKPEILLVLFVGEARSIASLFQKTVLGVPGSGRNKGHILRVDSLYEAGMFLATNAEISIFKVFLIIDESILELEEGVSLLESYENESDHKASQLVGGQCFIPIREHFLQKIDEVKSLSYVWDGFSGWNGADPRGSLESSVTWFLLVTKYLQAEIYTVASSVNSICPAAIRKTAEDIQECVQMFYQKK